MATSETGMTSEQELTDTAEEGETSMMESSPLHSPVQHSEDSNTTPYDNEETESAVSTDRESCSAASQTPTSSSTPNTPTTPGTRKHGLPLRQGLLWRKGERIEAMDYLNKWYPAKIMDIDEEEKAVLVHFEGWNQRYDEWTLMTSEGLRPLTRHSERKERGRKTPKEQFRPGEKVLAKWTDCKMYPGKVMSVHANGSLEVRFYDGFTKTVQPINVKPLLDKTKDKKSSPEARKPRRLEDDFIMTGKGLNLGKARSSSLDEGTGKDQNVDKRHKQKLIVAGSLFAKRERSLSAPSGQQKKADKIKRRGFGLKTSPLKRKREQGLKISPGNAKRAALSKKSPDKSAKEASKAGIAVVKRAKKRALSLPSGSRAPVHLGHDAPHTPSSAPAIPAKRAKSSEKDKSETAPKEFVIETDHNPFKCMIAGCTKSFRKENLLDYHLKYYHIDGGATPSPAASRVKRRKTSSICSTDSDISVSSKGKTTPGDGSSSKRKRNLSSASDILKEESFIDIKKEEFVTEKVVPSTPATPVTPVTPGLDTSRPLGGDLTPLEGKGQEETEDELAGDEVVNCVCGYNEENGLMIQCDVCLCWQHASCFSIKYDALPSKYTCFVCENPPGIRDSRRFIHSQDWYKTGQLPSFKFLHVKQGDKSMDAAKATHGLIADVINVKSVLHSLRQESKVSRDKNHREIKTWRRICEEKQRKAKLAELRRLASTSVDATEPCISDVPPCDVPKPDILPELPADDKPVVKVSVDEDAVETKTEIKQEDGPLAKSMGCQASLDISGSSMDQTEDKSFDLSANDIDSDTSTMTASECSVSYTSCLPSGPSASGLGIDDVDLEDRKPGEGLDQSLGEEELDIPLDEVEYEECERNMLLHIIKVQSTMNDRLDLIEEQIAALEKADPTPQVPPQPVPASSQESAKTSREKSALKDVPALKRSLHSLIRDMGKVKSMAAYH